MSATWLTALRAYVARTGPPSTAASRHRLYDQIAHAQLTSTRRGGSGRDARVRADNLAVLREARWALLREGTAREKSELLEHILKSLSAASDAATYNSPVAWRAPPSQRGRGRHDSGEVAGQRARKAAAAAEGVGATASVESDPSSSPAAPSASSGPACDESLSERHQLLLEQVQCLVEAKVTDIPLSARHYRHPLRSPLLAEVSPELPLLLLDELARDAPPSAGELGGAATVEWEAQVECCASLAGAGHVGEALALCGEDGQMFRAALQRVAGQRKDGWRQAWRLAEAVPMERVVGVAAPSGARGVAYSENWLRGVLEAVRLRHRGLAASHRLAAGAAEAEQLAEDESVALFEWVDELRHLLTHPQRSSTAAMTAAERRAWWRARRLVLDAYLSVCPSSRWRDAVGVVLEGKAAQPQRRPSSAAPSAVVEGDDEDDIRIGRVMALLHLARQPWVALLVFYGDPLALHGRESAPASARAAEQRSKAVRVWAVPDGEVQRAVEPLIDAAREAGRLAVAAGALLNQWDVQHPAIYNHAIAALAATGHHSEAVALYASMPAACVNAYTHWSVLESFLQPSEGDATAVAAAAPAASVLSSEENYHHCRRALTRLARIAASAESHGESGATSGDTSGSLATSPVPGDAEGRSRFSHEQAGLWESMALWAALRRDAEAAGLCSSHAPPHCRYVHLIALVAAANQKDAGAVGRLVLRICDAPRTTTKELSLAAAMVALYYPVSQLQASHAAHLALTEPAELADVYALLTRALGKSIGRSQARMDDAMQLLVDYVHSLLRRAHTPLAEADVEAAWHDVVVRQRVLHSTMDLVRWGDWLETTPGEAKEQQQARAVAVWGTVARLLQAVGGQQRLSVARAAPALVSVGAPAEIAIHLLPL